MQFVIFSLLQKLVYEGQDPPVDVAELGDRIQTSHVLVQRRMVKASFPNMKKRAGKLITVDGGHFEGRKL